MYSGVKIFPVFQGENFVGRVFYSKWMGYIKFTIPSRWEDFVHLERVYEG